jgi:hypothetical protein
MPLMNYATRRTPIRIMSRRVIGLPSNVETLPSVPAILAPLPVEWQKPYHKLAEEYGLSSAVDEGFSILNPYSSKPGIIQLPVRSAGGLLRASRFYS